MIKSLLLVFAGGGLGSMLRFAISYSLQSNLPYGTFIVNLVGSLLIGIFLGLFDKQILSQSFLLLLAVGFCGGFTTFSAFAVENLKMLESEQYLNFACYSIISVLVGIAFVLIGFKVAKMF